MTKRQKTESRDYYVVKSNEIIQKSRYALNLMQQKIILYIVSKIKPDDDENTIYTISAREYCEVCGIDPDSGRNMQMIKQSLKSVADKSMWIDDATGSTLVRWFNKIKITYNSGTIDITIHVDMRPFLLNLQGRYTQYALFNILAMRSKYGVRLYELLKSYENVGSASFEISELQKRMDCENYDRYFDFKRKALDVAVDDINTCADIEVSYTLSKTEKAYTGIRFAIRPTPADVYYARIATVKQRLGD